MNGVYKATIVAIALLVCVTLAPARAEEAPLESATDTAVPSLPEQPQSCASDFEFATEVGGLILPGLGCYPSGSLTCDDLISFPNSTCSCSTEVIGTPCRSCDREKGVLTRTTCSVCPGCYGPTCEIQACWDRTVTFCN